jgi:outer membrane immunogenic protein
MNKSVCSLARAAAFGLAAAGVLSSGTGYAADLAVKAPPARTATAYSWTGCYAGVFVGYAAANDWKGDGVGQFSLGNQATGGGSLACNWQANPWLVLGAEAEAGYLNVQGPMALGGVVDQAKLGTGYGLIAGRVGVAWDRLLVYTKIGVAFYDAGATVTSSNPVATGSQSQSPLAVGLGGEYAIFDHWTGKAEYVVFDRGTSFDACAGAHCFRQDPSTIQTLKVGLSYKFW